MSTKKIVVLTTISSLVVLFVMGAIVLGFNRLNSSAQSGGTASVAPASTVEGTITVVGEGKVSIKPDVARANIGVEIIGDSVKEASAESTVVMENLVATLKTAGVADKDIQTSGYNVWVERPYGPEGPTGDSLYHVTNSVVVTIRDLDKVGQILDSAIEAGANNIYGVSFDLADKDKVASQARASAVDDAEAKAAELAELNGVELGRVLSVSEVVGSSGGFYASNFSRAMYSEGLGGGVGPIEPGELQLDTQLEITYAIE